MKGLTLALFLLAVPACGAAPVANRKAMKGRKITRSLHKDTRRLQQFSDHAQRHGLKAMDFAHPIKSLSSDSSTEVAADYGVDVYDFVVDVGFTDTSGEVEEYPCIMDTGSSNLAVAISSCTNCGDGATTLDIDMADPEYCMEVTYGSGAWVGKLAASDVEITLGTLSGTAEDSVTGITYQDDFFEGDGYNGIFGLSYTALAGDYSSCSSSSMRSEKMSVKDHGPSNVQYEKERLSKQMKTEAGSEIAGNTLLTSWKDSGVIDSNMFTITNCDETATLSVGAIDESLYSGEMTTVPTQKTFDVYYGYFLVKVSEVTFDGSEVDLTDAKINEYGGVLVDSGTTLLYLPTEVVSSIKKTLEADYSSVVSTEFFEWETCLSKSEASELPDLTITFEGDDSDYTLDLSYERYLYYYDSCYYWGIGASSLGIIGNIAQVDLTIKFDLDNNEMGFATAVCSSDDEEEKETLLDSVFNVGASNSGILMVAGLVAAVAVVAVVRSRRQNNGYSRLATDEYVI